MVSTCPLISKSSNPCTNPLGTDLSARIIIGITVIFMFHSFCSLTRFTYLCLFSPSFNFTPWSAGTAKSTIQQVLFSFLCCFFFFLTITWSGRLAGIRWSVCISKSHRSLCISFSAMDSGLCIYWLFVRSNLNFLHNSLWIPFPTKLCLVLYSFYVNLLHLLIIWLIVSSHSPHNQHLLFCCVLSIFALT